jgi:hypothetical protein
MGQLLSQLAVVGQQQQSLAGTIQSADRKKSTAIGHQVDRANPTFWIAIGAEDTCWLIEHQVGGALLPEHFPIDADRAGDRIDSSMELDTDLPIDFDAPLLDEFFDLAPRTQPCSGQDAIQSLGPLKQSATLGRPTRLARSHLNLPVPWKQMAAACTTAKSFETGAWRQQFAATPDDCNHARSFHPVRLLVVGKAVRAVEDAVAAASRCQHVPSD